ncbi:MAG: T9SS type A sorting domain-containing protein [Saprospiraceae bacterium]|nr:T9SS type A sorting domain-containing protein [Saprospiraceae bacterium]MBP7699270.1 T9SS type A sorting domain-containing protein [Saprospiraceae bacterium]
MKKLFILALLTFCFKASVNAQCTPDITYQDSTFGVYPKPQSASNPNGGINIPACINEPYLFVFTVVVPNTVVINGISVPVDSIRIDSLRGLPIGLQYACNPSSCVFQKNTLDCIVINGTPTNSNTVGDYDLTVFGKGFTLGQGINITFPTSSTEGQYTLQLNPQGSPDCVSLSTSYLENKNMMVSNTPNPFYADTYIHLNSKIGIKGNLVVYNLLGKQVATQIIEITNGENIIRFDGRSLPSGTYIYTIGDKTNKVSGKLVKQ